MNKKSSEDKWFGTQELKVAEMALNTIVKEMKNPTYKQIKNVLECMQDFSEELCMVTIQK